MLLKPSRLGGLEDDELRLTYRIRRSHSTSGVTFKSSETTETRAQERAAFKDQGLVSLPAESRPKGLSFAAFAALEAKNASPSHFGLVDPGELDQLTRGKLRWTS
ncbi:hypothetical protein FOPE_10895 [Fonsecaea pedrosoi]|nr:hypothetical protein FOPE_10895 [Fonsecaea pedrosoi]